MLTDINNLSKEELKRFEDFINSPYFNKFETIKELFYYTKDKYPDVTPEDVTKEKLAQYIYGNTDVSDITLRKLESDYNKLFEQFLIQEQRNKYSTENTISLLPELREKRLFDTYKKKINEIEKYSEKDFGEDERYYMNKFNYYNELFIYTFTSFSKQTMIYAFKKIEYLTYYFIYQMLVYQLNLYSDKYYMNVVKQKPMSMISDVYKFLSKKLKYFSKKHVDIMILYYGNLMVERGKWKDYNDFQDYYRRNKFDPNLETMYYMYSENFLTRKISNEPSTETSKKLLKLRKEMFQKGKYKVFFSEGRTFPEMNYFYIFNDAVSLREFDWAEKFAKEFRKFLPHNAGNDVTDLVRIILDFFKEEYTDIYMMLNEINKNNSRLYMHSRYIKMMLLYEGKEISALQNEAEAMKRYLFRIKKEDEKVIAEKEKSLVFLGNINFLIRLSEGQINVKGNRFLQFKSGLHSGKNIGAYGFWFEEKIRELEKKKVHA